MKHLSYKGLLVVLALLLMASAVQAQSFPTPAERQASDIASYVTLAIPMALDVKACVDSPGRLHCFEKMAERDAATWAISEGIKRLVHKSRPCEPQCGIDAGTGSMPSMHEAFALSTRGGPRLAFTYSFALGTAVGRVGAGKHDVWDVLAGAGIGLVTSFIR